LDPATGIISGTVTEAGTYTVTTTVANAAEESSATLTLVISESALPFLSVTGTIQACLGQTLDYRLGAANAPTAAGVLGLPPGLVQYDYNDDGVMDVINGIPQVAGSFRVTFWAENALGRCTRSAIIRVNKPAVTTSAQMFEGLDVRAVMKDRQGNTFFGARLNGSIVLGGTTYTAVNGNMDGLVIKVSSAGQALWCYQLTGDRGCDLENLVVDSDGNVIACGGIDPYNSTFAGVAVSGQTFFVVKLTTAGVRTWTRVQGTGGSNVSCGALTVDGSNNIWVGGFFQGSLGFSNSSSTILTSASLEASNNGFVAGFSSGGTVLTPRLFSSTSVSHIRSLAAAPDGTVFVAGSFSGNLTVPGSGSAPTASITLTNPDGNASQPSFVACIGGAPAGTTTNAAHWAKQIPGGIRIFKPVLSLVYGSDVNGCHFPYLADGHIGLYAR
jgi:PKD repeat protein